MCSSKKDERKAAKTTAMYHIKSFISSEIEHKLYWSHEPELNALKNTTKAKGTKKLNPRRFRKMNWIVFCFDDVKLRQIMANKRKATPNNTKHVSINNNKDRQRVISSNREKRSDICLQATKMKKNTFFCLTVVTFKVWRRQFIEINEASTLKMSEISLLNLSVMW